MTPSELDEVSPVPCRYLFSTANATYTMSYASDVQWNVNDPEQEQLYYQMMAEVSQIQVVMGDLLDD